MQKIPAQSKHIPLIEEAFERSKQERRENFVDYLAEPAIADFHCDRLCDEIRNKSESPFSLYLDDSGIAVIVGTAQSPWHSEHYGVNYQKVQPFYCFTSDLGRIRNFIQIFKDILTAHVNTVYTLRCDGHQAALAYGLCEFGFFHVGTSVRMILHPPNQNIDFQSRGKYDSVTIRDFCEEDLPALQDIACENHGHSHFFRDLRLPPGSTQALFSEWIVKCARGAAQRLLVAERDDRIVGFTTLMYSQALLPYIQLRIGIIDFIVVSREAQGSGCSAILLNAGLDALFEKADRVELRTMAENLRAIRFYEKNGFRVLSSDHHFHYWT